MYKVKFFSEWSYRNINEKEINEFLKDNDVIPITIMYANNYYVLLYREKGE